MKIREKLILAFSFITILSIGSVSVLSITKSSAAIKAEMENVLNSAVEEKVSRIYSYIYSKEKEVVFTANQQLVGEALLDLDNAFSHGAESEQYVKRELLYREQLSQIKERLNIYDLFLISSDGDIVFSVIHEDDFGTNLRTGKYRESKLAEAFDTASSLLETKITTFEPYSPSQFLLSGDKVKKEDSTNNIGYEQHSAFVAAPVFHDDILIGVLAMQLSDYDYFHLASDYTSLKQTGEVVITKVIDDYAVVIAPLRRNPEAAFNMRFKMGADKAIPIQLSATGYRGAGVSIGYENTSVLAAWRHIPELKWGIVTKIESKEAFAIIDQIKNVLFIAGLGTLALAIFIGRVFSNHFSAPILRLHEASERFTKENVVTTDLKTQVSDEISQLSRAFVRMQLSHQENLASLSVTAEQQKLQTKYAHAKLKIVDALAQPVLLAERLKLAIESIFEVPGLDIQKKGGVFLADENEKRLNLCCHPGKFSAEFLRDEATVAYGACLCGRAAESQEILVSDSCFSDHRHEHRWDNMTEHGHYIIPILSHGTSDQKTLGVIFLYTDINPCAGSDRLMLLKEISELFSSAILQDQSRQAAENSVRVKSEFLASMSHEIRTPMNGVIGMLGALQKTELSEDQKRKATIAQTSASSLLTIINDILDFSKIEAGKLVLEELDFNLRGLLGDFADSMALDAQDKGIELVLELTGVEQTMVKGDLGRLRQILINIVGNAIKFTSSGEIVIRAELHALEEGMFDLHCSVSDTGIGIPKDKISTLFDSFSQADTSTTRVFGGTGLGLSISKHLSELMGGKLEVSSTLGEGSHFIFNIKLKASKQSEKVFPTVDIHNTSVLIVDDNDTNRDVLRGQLEHWGGIVSESNCAADALALLDKHYSPQEPNKPPFSVAFIDMQMPNMDGEELGQRIRADNRYNGIHLIMMTSMSSEENTQYFKELGFSGYFPKPATTSDLFGALAVVLENNKAPSDIDTLVTQQYLETLSHDKESIKGASILLVEDNRINQIVALNILESLDLIIDIADNGEKALAALKNKTAYQLILMDCQMPVMDGYETTKAIRQGIAGDEVSNIPIVAMTANAMKGDKEKCIDAGMDDYLSKPIDVNELENIIIKWVKAKP